MKKFLIALGTGLTMALAAPGAGADVFWTTQFYGVGDVKSGYMITHYDDKGKWLSDTFYDDRGKYMTTLYVKTHNPNPEGGDDGEKGDIKSRLNLALQRGGELSMTPAFAKTPLGKYLIGKGVGIVPVYQPSDDESGGPSTGMTGTELPTSFADANKELNDTEWLQGLLTAVPYEPNSGTVQEFFKSKLGKGPPPENLGNGDGDSNNEKLGADSGVLFGDLPGPPELVNPDPVTRGAAAEQQPGAAAQLPSDAAEVGGAGRTTAPSTATIIAPKQ